MESEKPLLSIRNAGLSFDQRTLWQGVDLDIRPGEFFTVLGPNGSGKTSFLKVLLGLQSLSSGTVSLDGRAVSHGRHKVGYIPQQKSFPAQTPLRGEDLVGLGVDGHRWGIRFRRRQYRLRVAQLLQQVGASSYAKTPVGLLSGGEQQRLRVAQALAGDPRLLLCDEPLLSLDLHHQRVVSSLLASRAREAGTAVVFVTHEINPVIDFVDRVLYLVDGRFKIGKPEEVMTSQVLSELYRTPVEVFRSKGRFLVAGEPDASGHHCHDDSLEDAFELPVGSGRR